MLITFHTGQVVKVEFDDALHSYVVAHKLPDGTFTDWRPTHGITTPLKMVPKEYLKKWVAKVCTNATLEYIADHPELVDSLPQFLTDLSDYYEVALTPEGKKKMTYYRLNKAYPWYKELKKAPDTASTVGKELGTWIHSAIENYYRSGKKELPVNTPETQGMWDSFLMFDSYYDLEYEQDDLEFLVYSLQFGYSGQRDFRGYVDGRYVILDWKSTNRSDSNAEGISTEYFYQLGGLAHAEFERTGKWPDDVGAVNLDKKGEDPAVVWASDFGMSPADAAKAYIVMFHGHHMHENWDYKFRKKGE